MDSVATFVLLAVALAMPRVGQTQPAPQQAVLETAQGSIVLDLLSDYAPEHVALFIKTAKAGDYDGTTFFRLIRYGLIQGGDPLTKDPAVRDRYGSGGLNMLKAGKTDEKHTRGAVSAVQIPGKPDSAGTQFFICLTDQAALDGKYTVFARVAEGILTAQKISEGAVDEKGLAVDRIVVSKVTVRDKPADTPEPFSTDPVAAVAQYRAVLETSYGDITLSFTPEKAPMHVRNFLRLAQAGVYDGMSFHRVVKGFVIQSGHVPSRQTPLNETQQRFVRTLKAELNDQVHDLGTLSMARLEDPDSGSSSFFIVTARTPALDGKYTVFGKVESGMDVVQKIEAVTVNGDAPVERVELKRVRLVK
jgi:peptidyl-prolyl cis-trans isomerase B (cyclophilin B)